jgi:hypothetical protein
MEQKQSANLFSAEICREGTAMDEPIQIPRPRNGSNGPTSAQLWQAIDSGETGDKVVAIDPAAAPLGTDDEAAGHPPTSEEIATAMADEASRPDAAGDRASESRAVLSYLLIGATVAGALAGGSILVRWLSAS